MTAWIRAIQWCVIYGEKLASVTVVGIAEWVRHVFGFLFSNPFKLKAHQLPRKILNSSSPSVAEIKNNYD